MKVRNTSVMAANAATYGAAIGLTAQPDHGGSIGPRGAPTNGGEAGIAAGITK